MHLDNSEYSTQSIPAQKVIATPGMSESGFEFKVLLAFFVALIVIMFFIFFYHCYIKQRFYKKSIKTHPYAPTTVKKSKSIILNSKPLGSNNSSREALVQKNKKEMSQSKSECIQFPTPLHKPGNNKLDNNAITVLESHETILSEEEGQIAKI